MVSRIINSVNRIDTRLLVFLILTINFLGIRLTGNEEQYMAYMKFFFIKDWMQESYWFNDFPGTRFFFQAIFGGLFYLFDFEGVVFIGRLLLNILFAVIFSKIFKFFKLSNVAVFILLQVIWVHQQNFFAGGSLLGGFQTKGIAYFFGLLAYYNFWKKKYWKTIFFLALAFSFHFSVGGWIIFSLGILFLFERLDFKELVKFAIVLLILISPVILYLYFGLIDDAPTTINDINTNWIYAYVRNPHHIAPFQSWYIFKRNFLTGIIISFCLFIACILIAFKIRNSSIKKINTLNIVLFAQQFTFLIVAAIDKNGIILKTYPFRTSVLSMFFVLIEMSLILKLYHQSIKDYFQRRKVLSISGYSLIFVLMIYSIMNSITKKTVPNFTLNYNKQLLETAGFLKDNSPPDATVLLTFSDALYYFPRFSERDVFYMQKFIPTKKEMIYEWYMRSLAWEIMSEDHTMIKNYTENYSIDYVVTAKPLKYDYLELVYSSGGFYTYRFIR